MTWKPLFFATVACRLLVPSPAAGESLPFAGLDDLRGPYEGTGAFGEALHVQPLGMAGNWPISAVWSSGNTSRSPFLGFGWSVPALESRFVPLDVNRWAFYQPDGYVRIFVRAGQGDDNVLTGGAAWTAVLKDDLIRVTADPHDGGPKSEFAFRQGRLVSMSCEEGSFNIKYSGRVADAITSRGQPVLEVVRESTPEKRTVFRFNGGRSQTVAVCRPATVFGQQGESAAALSSEENCLASLQTPTGTVAFAYGREDGEAFFDAGGTRWTWNPHTRKILSCGDWIYTIGASKKKEDDELKEEPPFARRRADGCRESYSMNRKTGLFVQEFTNGTSRAYKVFTSGPLAYRRARWTKETDADGASVRTDYTYNEAGRVVYQRITRTGKNVGTDEVWLDESGTVFRRRVDGKEVPAK